MRRQTHLTFGMQKIESWLNQEPYPTGGHYTDHPVGPLLYSKNGLPVGPFSTSAH